jgi:stage IV sporulation protein FB
MGFSIGRLFGTDIRATGGFFLLLGFYFLQYGVERAADAAIFCIAVIVSLLVHEFGHVFAVRWQLKSNAAVILWGLGGLCIHPPARRPGQRVVIALMGPAFEAVLGVGAILVWLLAPPAQPYLHWLVWCLVWINVIWLALNLIPVKPLDGGHALEAALEMRLGAAKATVVARRVSVVSAGLILAASIYLDLHFVAILALLLLLHNLHGRPEPR